jgi:hypothetical protein
MIKETVRLAKCFWLGLGAVGFFVGAYALLSWLFFSLYVWLGMGRENAGGFCLFTPFILIIATLVGQDMCKKDKKGR